MINSKNTISPKEKYNLGREFINSYFTIINIFENIKELVKNFIPKDDCISLEECDSHQLDITANEISELEFCFSKNSQPWRQYRVLLSNMNFKIEILSQMDCDYKNEQLIKIPTYRLKEFVETNVL